MESFRKLRKLQTERNFSLDEGVATLKRNRLSSEKLNGIIFLKCYIRNQN
jgi:hypothetical protein